MTGMGSYIRTLREKQGITRAWVAEQVNTSETSLYRIEIGKQAPATALLIGIVKAIKGSFDDVEVLLRGDGSKSEIGERLAESRLSAASDRIVADFVNGFTADELARVRQELANDPNFLDTIARQILRRQQ